MTDICHRKQNKNLSNIAFTDQLQKANRLLMNFHRDQGMADILLVIRVPLPHIILYI